MNPDRFLSPDLATRNVAHELYQTVARLPVVSPHGHVDPRLIQLLKSLLDTILL